MAYRQVAGGLAAVFAIDGAAVGVEATPITVVVSGTIETIQENNLPIGGSVAIGSPYTLLVQFDPDAGVDLDPDPAGGEYRFAPPDRMRLEVGDYVLETSGPFFSVFVYDLAEDSIDFITEPTPLPGPDPPMSFIAGAGLLSSLDLLSGDGIRVDLLDPALWEVASTSFAFQSEGIGSNLATGSIDDIVVVPVPEPATWLLTSFGLAVVSARRRQVRQAAREAASRDHT